ncbi:hypothetical protein D3C75_294370 [compost metagenome]
MRRDRGVHIGRDVPVVRQVEFEIIAGTVLGIRDQKARAAFVTHRQLQVRAVEDRHRAELKAGVPDLSNLLFAVVDHFAADHAPGIRAWQTGGKGAVLENGIAVFAALLHQIGFTAALASDHLVIAFPDIGIFSIQIRPGFRTFQNDLIIVIVHITERIHRTYRLNLAFWLLLMQLNFIGQQTAVTLVNIHIAAKHRIVRVVTFRVISGNGDRQRVRITLNQRAIVAGDAQHTLRGKIGRQPLLTVQGCSYHRGQEGGDTFFHTFYLLFRHQWLIAGKRSETILLIIAVPALILPVSEQWG